MKKEENLMLDLIKVYLNKSSIGKIKNRLNQELDWQYIYDNSMKQGIAPLIFKSLNHLKFDKEITDAFKQFYDATYKRNLKLYKELEKISKAFEKENIDFILLKGIYLAKFVYKDIGLRSMCDIDILIKKEDLPKIIKLLKKQGYNSSKKNDHYHKVFVHIKKKICLEMHFNFTTKKEFFSINPKIFFNNKKELIYNKNIFPVFNNEFQLMHLCFHISHHMWESSINLRWFFDLSKFIEVEKIDFKKFNKLINKLNLNNSVYAVFLIYMKYLDPGFDIGKIKKTSFLSKIILYLIIKRIDIFKWDKKWNKYFEFMFMNNTISKIKFIGSNGFKELFNKIISIYR